MAPASILDAERCVGCGACATLAPALFAVTKRARLVRVPETAAERIAFAAAAIVCPTQAIRAQEAP